MLLKLKRQFYEKLKELYHLQYLKWDANICNQIISYFLDTMNTLAKNYNKDKYNYFCCWMRNKDTYLSIDILQKRKKS